MNNIKVENSEIEFMRMQGNGSCLEDILNVDLYKCEKIETYFDTIQKLINCKCLILSFTTITVSPPLRELTNLQEIYLRGCEMDIGILVSIINDLMTIKTLNHLCIEGIKVLSKGKPIGIREDVILNRLTQISIYNFKILQGREAKRVALTPIVENTNKSALVSPNKKENEDIKKKKVAFEDQPEMIIPKSPERRATKSLALKKPAPKMNSSPVNLIEQINNNNQISPKTTSSPRKELQPPKSITIPKETRLISVPTSSTTTTTTTTNSSNIQPKSPPLTTPKPTRTTSISTQSRPSTVDTTTTTRQTTNSPPSSSPTSRRLTQSSRSGSPTPPSTQARTNNLRSPQQKPTVTEKSDTQ
ncbi:hypothetical protein PPL_06586 [Heterostelium album PN500]|uniref:Uncharacterized protein n=1 Tax=Heterostelium pallidum (strain ATCC 26659 / Pp 5 / PN500) TaxID=670386 RepID=D3BF53_HETP5|nr:hypothetical protein PPL_06586 [Heterostelium album PN500]EFA79767.1 hypothetical protein PPL_06586 [Heterostelium album PN500]|eukprot:XP_020431888.1 hypothetical protein PPL_06586 [Heterostelium album PN500]